MKRLRVTHSLRLCVSHRGCGHGAHTRLEVSRRDDGQALLPRPCVRADARVVLAPRVPRVDRRWGRYIIVQEGLLGLISLLGELLPGKFTVLNLEATNAETDTNIDCLLGSVHNLF